MRLALCGAAEGEKLKLEIHPASAATAPDSADAVF